MKKTVQILSILSLLTTPVLANVDAKNKSPQSTETYKDTSVQKQDEQRAIVSTRPLSKKERRKLQKNRAAAAKLFNKKNKRHANSTNYTYIPSENSYIAQFALHSIHDISTKGDSVEIENGALFRIRDYDVSTAALWKKGNVLHITPNTRWFSSYEYQIHNRDLNTSVEAKLSLGPFVNSPYTRRIARIDAFAGVVVLDDNTLWKISDTESLRKWQANDIIILGENTGWSKWWSGYNYILINVAEDSYLAAKSIY